MKFLDTLNRIVIVIACLVLLVVLILVFLMPHVVLTSVGQWMVGWGTYLQIQDDWVRLGGGLALAVVTGLLVALVIYLEVRRGGRGFIRVQQVAGGTATISTESVTDMLQSELAALPGVVTVTPHVRAKGNRVAVHVEVGVAQGTNVPQTANYLIKETQATLTDELGLQIAGHPEVRVTVVEPETPEAESVPLPSGLPGPEIAESEPPDRSAAPPLPADADWEDENHETDTDDEAA